MAGQDIGSTPAGYMTPEQIAGMNSYAGNLTKGATRDDTITSPFQGIRMMVDALSGNLMRNRAGQQQQQNLGIDAATKGMQTPPLLAPAAPAPGAPPQMQAPPQQQPITPTPPVRPPPSMSGSPVPGLQGSVPSGTPGGMPGAPVDPMQALMMPPPMQALMMPPPGQGMA